MTLIGFRNNSDFTHYGTGTLIKSGRQHFIFTAAHCAERLADYDEIGLPIRLSGYPLIIKRMTPIYVSERKTDDWGPDLAFLPIHQIDVENISANSNKVFYNFDRHADEILQEGPRIENSLWAVVGTPAVLSNLSDPNKAEFTIMAYQVGIRPPITRDNFDYIHIRVALDGKNALPTFGGLSGGGLWHADIQHKEDGSVTIVGQRRLVGCAFYQTKAEGGFRYIRCHGPRSIYEYGLSKLKSL